LVFLKNAIERFYSSAYLFTYCQRKGSIQPLPEGQRYNLPLDPSSIKLRDELEEIFRKLMIKIPGFDVEECIPTDL
jgi:hypothetical protein